MHQTKHTFKQFAVSKWPPSDQISKGFNTNDCVKVNFLTVNPYFTLHSGWFRAQISGISISASDTSAQGKSTCCERAIIVIRFCEPRACVPELRWDVERARGFASVTAPHSPHYQTTTQSDAFLFGLQWQTNGAPVLDWSMSVWLSRNVDSVPAIHNCAARIPGLPGWANAFLTRHLGFICAAAAAVHV